MTDIYCERYRKNELPAELEVGDNWVAGWRNKAGSIAFAKGYVPTPKGSQEFPVESGYQRVTVLEIKECYRPKKGTNIHAWTSDKDYSNNPDFEKVYEYILQKEELYVDLMDLINPVPTLMETSIIRDEKDNRQFFCE